MTRKTRKTRKTSIIKGKKGGVPLAKASGRSTAAAGQKAERSPSPSRIVAPIRATRERDLIRLPRDNYSTPEYWILVSTGYVTIGEQKPGEPATKMMRVDKTAFNNMVRWYMTGSARATPTKKRK